MAEQGQEVHPDNKQCCSSPPLVDSLWYDRDLIPVEEMNTGSNLSTTSRGLLVAHKGAHGDTLLRLRGLKNQVAMSALGSGRACSP